MNLFGLICLVAWCGTLCFALEIPSEQTTFNPVEETTVVEEEVDPDVSTFPVEPTVSQFPGAPSSSVPTESAPLRLDLYAGLRVVNSTIIGNAPCRK